MPPSCAGNRIRKLKAITVTRDSGMSKRLASLADAGFITVRKASSDGRQRTWTTMTGTGRTAFDAHISALHRILARNA